MDMITDSHTWLHGKRFALWGDPDFVMGLTRFLLELGAEPTHVLCHNANKRGQGNDQDSGIVALRQEGGGPHRQGPVAHALAGVHRQAGFHDRQFLWEVHPARHDHQGQGVRGALDPPGLPIFDRHHLHRDTTLGYEGAMSILKTLVNAVLERLDQDTMGMGTTDYNFDLIR